MAKILSFDLAGLIPISKPKFPSLEKISKGVYLGRVSVRNIPFFWNPDPSTGMKNPHIVVLGVTGSGKSCTMKTIITMAWCLLDLEGILIIDFKGEYSSLVENLGGKVVYFGKGGKINPFELAECHVNDRINQVVEMFKALNNWGPRQTNVFTECVKRAYAEKGFVGNGPYPPDENAPKLKDVVEQLKRMKENSKSQDTRNRIDALLEYLERTSEGGSYDFWSSSSNVKVGDLLSSLVNIDLSGINDIKAKEFIAWTILQYIYAQLRGINKLRVMIVLDECHRICKDKHSLPVKLIKEGRSAGFAVLVGTQSPFDVDDEILSNAGTRIIHQIDKSNYVYEISKTLGLTRREEEIIKTLGIGECLVQINSDPSRPAVVKIDYDLIKDIDASEKLHSLPENSMEKRGVELEEVETKLLLDIAENPASKIVERYKRIGVNEYQGNKAQRKLLEKGLVESFTLKDLEGNYWGKTLRLTEKGIATLTSLGFNLKESMRRGGTLHLHIIKQIEDLLTREGLSFQEEFPVGNGRTVDLYVYGKAAIEVETGESNMEKNLEKLSGLDCLKIVVCANSSVKRKVEEIAKNFEEVKVVETKEFSEVLKMIKEL
ncbi:MAG: ATP-binding protein [Candidatus Bathyarchaeia archaeon]